MEAQRDPGRIDWGRAAALVGLHAGAAAAPLLVHPRPALLALAGASWLLRSFGISAGYHRLLAHRAGEPSRGLAFALAAVGATAGLVGPLRWAARHREHHRASDTAADPHSPIVHGLAWSHLGWLLVRRRDAAPFDQAPDLAAAPELRWLDRHPLLPPAALAAAFALAGGLPGLLWGFCVSTVLVLHGALLPNSLGHLIGRRRYETGDESRNCLAVSLLTLGEGWGNNHHFFASAARHGWFWWEPDPTWLGLRALAALGLVRGLRPVPPRIRLAHLRVRSPDDRAGHGQLAPGQR